MSLSNTQIISLLNRYFVPVVVSNEDYEPTGRAPKDEKAELTRIHQEGHAARLSVGSVHVYLLRPDGRLLDSMHTAPAANPKNLIPMLEKAARSLGTPAGRPIIPPTPPAPPEASPGELRLHLTARWLAKQDGEYVLTGQDENDGNWGALSSVDWILLGKEQWKSWLPPRKARVGDRWTVTREAASPLVLHFYPPTENWELETNRIDRLTLQGTVVSIKNGVIRSRLDGTLRMKHPFYHKDDDNFVTASFIGFLDSAADGSKILSFRLVTDEAAYGTDANPQPFGIAVRSL